MSSKVHEGRHDLKCSPDGLPFADTDLDNMFTYFSRNGNCKGAPKTTRCGFCEHTRICTKNQPPLPLAAEVSPEATGSD